jgi:Raf kinase inhibitor-like YbhB/YbcL family protein
MMKQSTMALFGWLTAVMLPLGALAESIPAFQIITPHENGMWGHNQVYQGFGCTGHNWSPALQWQGAPADTQSFAITVFDPDAPTGSGWWHWTVANLPPTTTGLPMQGPLPDTAVQGRNDYGQAAFGGACPPQGDKPHRYEITVWALKVPNLPVTADSSGALVGYMVRQNALAQAQTVVRYGR